jgi:antitoxin (DNA-binding transcriptional repressor) of toxin-antitoxin stability system
MGTLRISEAELARDIHAVLAKVQEGMEVVVEQDHRAVATIKPATRSGRPISACIASAKASGSKVTLDGGFGKDVRVSSACHQQCSGFSDQEQGAGDEDDFVGGGIFDRAEGFFEGGSDQQVGVIGDRTEGFGG